MKGENNGQRRRREKAKATYNTTVQRILEQGHPFQDARGRWYTSLYRPRETHNRHPYGISGNIRLGGYQIVRGAITQET